MPQRIIFSKFILGIIVLLLVSNKSFSQNWQKLNDVPFLKHHTNGFSFQEKAYIIEGGPEGGFEFSNRVWEYNPSNDTWTHIQDFPGESRGYAIGDDWEGKYYYGFGWGADTLLNDLWVFDPVDKIFTQLPSCPCSPRSHPALIAHNDKIFMGTGSGDIGNLEDWWVYDILTQEWTQKEDVPGGARHHPYFFSADRKIYVGGGHRDNWWEYDMDQENWIEIDNLPGGRVAGTQLNYEGMGLIIAGDDAEHGTIPKPETFMFYSPETGSWDYLEELPDGSRWAPSSFINNDVLYFFGGIPALDSEDASMWKYDLSMFACLPAKNLKTTLITETSANIIWSQTTDALSDTLKWREFGSQEWNSISNPQAVFVLEDLVPCNTYELKLVSQCDSQSSSTENVRFTTMGCGSCTDFEFCPISADFEGQFIFIDEVRVNNFINNSGSDDGYGNFALPDAQSIVPGESVDLTLVPGIADNGFPGVFSAWIDYNGNGIFEEDELILEQQFVADTLKENILIPITATSGLSRMRISYGVNFPSAPCDDGSFQLGEVEDYCLNITDPLSASEENDYSEGFNIYPNPFKQTINLSIQFGKISNSICELSIINTLGETLLRIKNFDTTNELDLSKLHEGIYFLKLQEEGVFSNTIKIFKQN